MYLGEDLQQALHCNGYLLTYFYSVLSDKKYPGKVVKSFNLRVQKIDNILLLCSVVSCSEAVVSYCFGLTSVDVNNALNFTYNCGIQMKVKPSPENLADCEEKTTLGLIWAVSFVVML